MVEHHPCVVGGDQQMFLGRQVKPTEHTIDRRRKRQMGMRLDQAGHQRRPATIHNVGLTAQIRVPRVVNRRDQLSLDLHCRWKQRTTRTVEDTYVTEHDRTHTA